MPAALTYHTVTIEEHTCGECGVVFGMTSDYIEARRNDHGTWYCPNGHPRVFVRKSEAERQRERAQRAEAQLTHARDQLEATERSRRAQKAATTRLRRRIANGVCPWCRRSFPNVVAHVGEKHPEHRDEVSTDAS